METYFWNRYVSLCKMRGLSPSDVAIRCGLGNSVTTRWRKGSIPQKKTLQKVADFFHVSIDYLSGYDEEPLNPDELKLLKAYKKNPEMQEAVKRLLEIK